MSLEPGQNQHGSNLVERFRIPGNETVFDRHDDALVKVFVPCGLLLSGFLLRHARLIWSNFLRDRGRPHLGR